MKIAKYFSLNDAVSAGAPPPGNLATPIFSNGSMEAELYQPIDHDPQTPHSRDEIYIIADGKGEFFDGEKNIPVCKGGFLFVPAGVEHRFVNFSEDFKVWVIFYGPEGGE